MAAEVITLPRRGDLSVDMGYEALPPRDQWLVDIDNTQIDTPVDERGLVDPREVIRVVGSMVQPEFEWPNRLSVHHMYWNARWYGFPSAGPKAELFRELSIHKMLVRRMFENVLHKVMVPPAVPSAEVMEGRIESWSVAWNLFSSVRTVVRWEKSEERYLEMVKQGTFPEGYETEDEIGRAILRGAVQRYFKGIDLHMRRLGEVPTEFRLIEPDDITASPRHRQEFGKRLGQVVAPKALPMARLLNVA